MIENRRLVAEHRGVAVAWAYELSRQATVVSTETGDVSASQAIAEALKRLGAETPEQVSTDLVSCVDGEVRLIEVKSRGSSGPVEVVERQLNTLRAASAAGWLYVVWNTTQSQPFELWTIPNAGSLPWAVASEGQRPPGTYRGVQHESRFRITASVVESNGQRVDLRSVSGLPAKNSW